MTKGAGPWVENMSRWMSSAINSAFRDIDYERWSLTSYAREMLSGRGSGKGNRKSKGMDLEPDIL